MIREGEQDVTLRYLRKHPRLVAISNYSDGIYMPDAHQRVLEMLALCNTDNHIPGCFLCVQYRNRAVTFGDIHNT